MTQITIEIDDSYANTLVELLNAIKFVRSVSIIPRIESQSLSEDGDFFSLAGIWDGRDVDLQTIRNNAWPARPL